MIWIVPGARLGNGCQKSLGMRHESFCFLHFAFQRRVVSTRLLMRSWFGALMRWSELGT